MRQSIKRLTKHSAIYGVGHILTRAVAFLLLPLYTNVLSPGEFGIAVLLLSLLAILNIIYLYGMDSAFLRYYIVAEDALEKRIIFSTAFLTTATTALLFSAFGYASSPFVAELLFSSAELTRALRFCAGILLFDCLAALPFLLLRASERSLAFVSYKAAIVVLNLALNIWFLAFRGMGIDGIFLANLLSSAMGFLLVVPLAGRHLRLHLSGAQLKALLRFGLPYIPSTLSVILMDVLDRFFLEYMADERAVGIYSAGYRLGMFMALFVAAFRFAWHPFFLSTAKESNAKAIFSKVLTYFLFACVSVYLLVAYFVDDLVRLSLGKFSIFGPEYWQSTGIVPIVMLAYILYGTYVNFVVGIHLHKKTRYLPLITGAGLAANILFNALLIPRYTIYGAAWATVASYLVMAAGLYVVAQRLYPVRYEFGQIVKLALIGGSYQCVLYLFKPAITLKFVLALTYPLVLVLSGIFNQAELAFLKRLARRQFSTGPA